MSATRPGVTRFTRRGVSRLAYEVAGGAEGETAVALLHALLGDRHDLAGVRDALGGWCRIVSPEARGHGASTAVATQRLTVGDLAGDLAAILDAEGIGRAHLVGIGLGGTIAVETARRWPERTRTLTLIEPTLPAILDEDRDPAALDVAAVRAVFRTAADAAYKGLTDRALDLLLDAVWGRGWRERLARPRLAAIRRHVGALASTLPALDAYRLSREDVAAISLPALVICRTDARPLDWLTCARLADWLPMARLVTIPGGNDPAHPLAGDVAVVLAQRLLTFLGDGDGSAG